MRKVVRESGGSKSQEKYEIKHTNLRLGFEFDQNTSIDVIVLTALWQMLKTNFSLLFVQIHKVYALKLIVYTGFTNYSYMWSFLNQSVRNELSGFSAI